MPGNRYTFCLPDIGEGVVEGEVIEWLKNEGDAVRQDEPVVTVMTDKATVELPAPYPGTIVKQYYAAGQVAIKDKPLYDIEVDPSVVLPVRNKEKKCAVEAKSTRVLAKAKEEPEARPRSQAEVLAVPKVRRMAREWGIDLADVAGSGKDGRIFEDDLRRARSTSSEVPCLSLEGDEEHPLTGVRGVMARKMDQVRIPQFSYFEQVDATRLIEMHLKFKEKAKAEGINLSFMPFLIRALSLVMKKHPLMNASLDMGAGKVIVHHVQNIGIAMATPHGLIVPVLKGVEEMGLNDIIRSYDQLKAKGKEGRLSPEEMKEATMTISNFGVLGGEGLWATPMVSPPEVAIMAVARIREMPVAKDGQVFVKSVLPMSWSFDHRLIDGELAATISNHYCAMLREPVALL